MAIRHATFVLCDRCGSESEYKSGEDASRYSMQLQVTGLKQTYAPHHEGGSERSHICGDCSRSFGAWWREGKGSASAPSEENT